MKTLLPRNTSVTPPDVQFCNYLNVSICPLTESAEMVSFRDRRLGAINIEAILNTQKLSLMIYISLHKLIETCAVIKLQQNH